MAKQKKGIFNRIVEGPERSEDYARKTLPHNRWALGWDLFKTNLGKLVKINLLMILFLFPIFIALYFRNFLITIDASSAPFNQNIGFGYPVYPFLAGVSEQMVVRADIVFSIVLLIVSFYVNIGLAGGFYVMRNLVWTEGVFVASDFWAGVKKNYKNLLPHTILFVFLFSFTFTSIHSSDLQIALNPNLSVLFNVIKVISWIFVGIISILYLFSMSLSVTYKLKFFDTLKNSFILSIGLIPANAFFLIFSVLPFALLLVDMTSIFFSFGLILVLILSISTMLLIWTNYSQWVYDETINDKIAGAKKNRGIYKKKAEEETEEFVYKKSTLTSKPIKPITDYDIEIAELPTTFSRADLVKLEESKKRMREDSDKYSLEHAKKDDKSVDDVNIDKFMDSENNG